MEFFIRWGMVPDAGTKRYAAQFPKEERALYYLTDDARAYEIEHGVSASIEGRDVITASSGVTVSQSVPNEVTVTVGSSVDPDVLLGYEIIRYQYVDGKRVGQVVGFTVDNSFVDHVSTINNRVMDYEVRAVDKFGYYSNAMQVGTVRISHDGSHDKSAWTLKTNLSSDADTVPEAQESDPCEPVKEPAVTMVIDNDYSKTYTGTTSAEDAVILLQFNQVLETCGLKYTVKYGTPIGAYAVEVSVDGSTWTTVKTGIFDRSAESQTIYFENGNKDPWVCTYDAAYLRIKALGQSSISVTELDVLGPTGDSIAFGTMPDSTTGAVGILGETYVYEAQTGKSIPQGSLIFTGSYKGNPATNVVVLYDEQGNIVGGTDEEGYLQAEQIILAKVPEHGELGEVSDGIWIYWIAPDAQGQIPVISGKVRAQLYRVDDALTNAGQRLVSDTMPLTIPAVLDTITIKGNADAER